MTEPISTGEAAEPDRWEGSDRHEETPPLVADLADESVTEEAPGLDADTGSRSRSSTASEPESEADAEPEVTAAAESPAEEPEEDTIVHRLADIAVLLEEAAGSEETAAGQAAVLYGDAIVACLDATEDPLASSEVRPALLTSFDRLSSLLERGGLPEEALRVVDDAASLGLLDDGHEDRVESREAIKDRRESLRRVLFADSAQL